MPEGFIEDTEEDGWLMGIRYEKRTKDSRGRGVIEREYDDVGLENEESIVEQRARHIVHVIREYGQPPEGETGSNFLGTVVVVKSTLLIELFRKIVTYYPEQSLDKPEIETHEPHRFLYHHFQELRSYISDNKNDERTRKHAQVLIRCLEKLDQNEPSIIQTAQRFLNSPLFPRIISFDLLWLVYKPGTVILRRSLGNFRMRAYIVHSLAGHDRGTTHSTLVSI